MGLNDNIISAINGVDGAFSGRILNIEIKPFTKETTRKYLTEKADDLKLDESGFERFYKCTKGIPFYINTFAKLLSKNTTLDDKKVKKEFEESLNLLAARLIKEWTRLNLREQDIFISLIDKPLKRNEIAKKLEVSSASLSKPINNLINKNLIGLNNDKKYIISEKILSLWLKKEYEHKSVYPYK